MKIVSISITNPDAKDGDPIEASLHGSFDDNDGGLAVLRYLVMKFGENMICDRLIDPDKLDDPQLVRIRKQSMDNYVESFHKDRVKEKRMAEAEAQGLDPNIVARYVDESTYDDDKMSVEDMFREMLEFVDD